MGQLPGVVSTGVSKLKDPASKSDLVFRAIYVKDGDGILIRGSVLSSRSTHQMSCFWSNR